MNRSCWNLLVYRVPPQPSTQRVYVWRKLKAWGALYLQQSVCLLPYLEGLHRNLKQLQADIIANDGEADLLTLWIEEPEQNANLVDRFQQQAKEEYQEFFERCQALHQELSKEREAGKLIFAELEENEAELTKLQAWLPKIRERDLFEAPDYEQARQSLNTCVEDLQLFSQQVYEAQGVHCESSE